MFFKCSGHLLYCLMILLVTKGKIKAEWSSVLDSLGAPKIRLDGVASGFFKNATGAWGICLLIPDCSVHLQQVLGVNRVGQMWGYSGHRGGCRLFCAETTKLSCWRSWFLPCSLPALSARTAVLPGLWQSALDAFCTLFISFVVLRSRWMAETWESSGVLLAPVQKLYPSPLPSLTQLFRSLGFWRKKTLSLGVWTMALGYVGIPRRDRYVNKNNSCHTC